MFKVQLYHLLERFPYLIVFGWKPINKAITVQVRAQFFHILTEILTETKKMIKLSLDECVLILFKNIYDLSQERNMLLLRKTRIAYLKTE